MGKRLCIEKDLGETQYNWEFVFTINGSEWLTVLFEVLDDAREYASEVCCENESNPRFKCYARRILQVSTSDFFDSCYRESNVRVIQEHSDYRGL